MRLDELLEQEYSPKAAEASAQRAREAAQDVKTRRERERIPLANEAALIDAADALARALGARRPKRKGR